VGVLERAGAEGGACSEARLGVMAAGPAESFRVQATACHRSLPLLSSRRFFSRGLVLFGSFVPPPGPVAIAAVGPLVVRSALTKYSV
jgi:hypothetical protein